MTDWLQSIAILLLGVSALMHSVEHIRQGRRADRKLQTMNQEWKP
jgi:hypothetical protein